MDDNQLVQRAHELQRDLDTRGVRRLYAQRQGPDSVDAAYRLQRALRRTREERGDKVVGFKIGYTSPAVRNKTAHLMGLKESVHGYLWDTEAHPNSAEVDHRRLGIEGELAVTILSSGSDDVAEWEVDYEPIIELHMMGMDGPAEDDNGRRGLELIGANCIHAGVVHCDDRKRALLGDVPLDSLMTVHIGGELTEQVTLNELNLDGVRGPVGTIRWLLRTLREEGNGDEELIKDGALLLCSTPGGLHPVPPGVDVKVVFEEMTTTCIADRPG